MRDYAQSANALLSEMGLHWNIFTQVLSSKARRHRGRSYLKEVNILPFGVSWIRTHPHKVAEGVVLSPEVLCRPREPSSSQCWTLGLMFGSRNCHTMISLVPRFRVFVATSGAVVSKSPGRGDGVEGLELTFVCTCSSILT